MGDDERPDSEGRSQEPLATRPLVGATTTSELVEFGSQERTQLQMVIRRFLRHRLAVVSLLVFILLIFVSFAGNQIARFSYEEVSIGDLSQPPSSKHWFGTDSIGRDSFARVLRGARGSMIVALIVTLLSTTFGTLVGALAGYYRKWVDAGLMRLTDLFLTIPVLAVLLVFAARFRGEKGNLIQIALLIAAFAWTGLARVVRGVFLSLREREFVEAARALGAKDSRIIVRHMLPNAVGPIIVAGTLSVAEAILLETALSFLGFGINPPDISLGRLVADGAQAALTRPWLFYLPGLFLMMIALTVNFIGDGLRDALDPQQTRVRE